ncbi:hypothetical protein HDU99_003938 [Rhizoclosmatium hyalinum]|nr:hypothetical protein HDU99_003938 [Rhizoclosmatium hyalinum]
MAALFRSKSIGDLLRRKDSDANANPNSDALSIATGTGTVTQGGSGSGSGTLISRVATLARVPTLGRSNRERDEEPVILSDSGVPITAPSTLAHLQNSSATASLDRSFFNKQKENKEVAPNPVKLNASKAAQPTTLKWWQAPGVTKETQAALENAAAAAADPDSGPNNYESLPRKATTLGRSNTLNTLNAPSTPTTAAGAVLAPFATSGLKFDQFQEVAIIKNNLIAIDAKAPKFGQVPKLLDKCGAGATVTVIHNFTSTTSSDLSISIDDIVRILRVDMGGWVHVKLLKQGSSPNPNHPGKVHRSAGTGSQVGMEGLVPLGCLDSMKTRRIDGGGGGGPGPVGNGGAGMGMNGMNGMGGMGGMGGRQEMMGNVRPDGRAARGPYGGPPGQQQQQLQQQQQQEQYAARGPRGPRSLSAA